jgi:glycosyltransferase involved in cell wall biosynthesis
VGDGTERARLESLVRERGLGEAVRLTGDLPREEVARRLRGADVFVTLSVTDGLSTSLIEAMACGLVPVVSDIPGNRAVIEDGRNGLVVGGDDPRELAEALGRIERDAGLRARIRRENLSLADERFDLWANTRRIVEAAAEWGRAREGAAAGR